MIDKSSPHPLPGQIVLFGSGETSPSGRKVFDSLLRQLPPMPRLALLETPAGFELNSERHRAGGRILAAPLAELPPAGWRRPARKRGTPFSPDDPAIVAPLLSADLIFMGTWQPHLRRSPTA
jgi:hypothetical protein